MRLSAACLAVIVVMAVLHYATLLGVAPGSPIGLHGLDVGLDLDLGPELGPHSLLEAARDLVRRGKPERP